MYDVKCRMMSFLSYLFYLLWSFPFRFQLSELPARFISSLSEELHEFDENRAHPDGWDKSKLVSRYVTEGVESAPHRSYYYAMGLSEEEIHQPLVGVATCWNEAAPCNIALSRQAQAVKKGGYR